ncbi:MAG: Fe-S cluster assembly protein SufD [Alphaproteobacteria bacterium]|nr:Fe-S cluster assembly protein SufD [Alphaproteobacteria bacterium]
MTVSITPAPSGEEWKYTNTKEITNISFEIADKSSLNDEVLSMDKRAPVIAVNAHIIAVVNGYVQELPEPLPEGITLNENDNGKISLNIAANTILDKPIHLVFMTHTNPNAKPIAFYPQFSIYAEQGCSATIIESHIGRDEPLKSDFNAYFSNPIMDMQIADNAKIRHYKLQEEDKNAYHIALSNVTIGKDADYEAFITHTGAKIARNEIRVLINGKNSNCNINGAYITSNRMHIDNTTFIDHAVPNANSNQVFKGILDDESCGVYQGKILVRKDSQKTDGRQLHKALLLSNKAETNCKPELIIYADDVQCAHGATSGELDDKQIFYMRSRGLDENQSRKMLINAFLDDVVNTISDESVKDSFKNIIDRLIDEHL